MKYDPRKAGALCDVCPLRACKPVFPEGPPNSDVAIVGEAPGFMDERLGRLFSGGAGDLLNEILEHVGLDRDRLHVNSVVLCRPEVPNMTGGKRWDLKTYLSWLNKENAARRKEAKKTKSIPELIPSPVDCCETRLKGELQALDRGARDRRRPNGLVVVPIGNFAAKIVTGLDKGIMKLRGSPIEIDDETGVAKRMTPT